jgi:DNA-binding transcriptional LysR family regulator
MEIRQLRRFLVLADELHFGRAAERLHIAQPALSQELKSLEDRLGVRLFERSNRNVILTEAGRRLVDEATAVLERYDSAIAVMDSVRASTDAQLRLGVSVGVDQALLGELLRTATGGAMQPEVILHPATAAEGLHGLRNGDYQAVFIHAIPQESRDVEFHVLAQEPMGVAVPAGSPFAAQQSVRPMDLSGQPVIWLQRDGDPELCDRILHVLTAGGMIQGPQRKSPNIDTSLSLVAAGLGVSFKVPHEVPGDSHRGVVWRPFSGVSIPVPTTLVWRRDDNSPLLAKLVTAARNFHWPA